MQVGDFEVQIIRSSRKTAALQLTRDGQLLARVPYRMPEREIREMVDRHEKWIRTHMERQRQAREKEECQSPVQRLTQEEIRQLARQALWILTEKTQAYAARIGVTYGRITIRNQKTRWGSCSTGGNLNYNCLLMLAPPEIQDYVVVHELCHRKEMNHSPAFWAEVERVLPDYQERRKWLRDHGEELMRRAFG